ncbi:hypothetical protein SJS43_20830 [Aeromonas caviae]|nr:hypothetical protein [Aeromonas caviae]MDX7821464.1 hypothetical protein [Aeromonas caviae]
MRRLDVPKRLAERGQQVLDGLDSLLKEIDAPDWLRTAGHPSWSFLLVADSVNHSTWLLKSYLIQELCKRGILTLGSHNMNLAHSEQDVTVLLAAYRDILPALIHHDHDKSLTAKLHGKPIQPVFKVR